MMADDKPLTADDLRALIRLLEVEVSPTYDHEIDCLARGLTESCGPGALLPARLLLALLGAKLQVLELEDQARVRWHLAADDEYKSHRADEHDTHATLERTDVIRHYLAVIGGFNLVALGNEELERFIVSSIRTPDELFGLRLVQALLEARLALRDAQAEAIQADRQARADLAAHGVEVEDGIGRCQDCGGPADFDDADRVQCGCGSTVCSSCCEAFEGESYCARCVLDKLRAAWPGDLRAAGWSVAVHNDYRQDGKRYTFWLMVKDGRALKGEGRTDGDALDEIRAQVKALEESHQARQRFSAAQIDLEPDPPEEPRSDFDDPIDPELEPAP
jgi:hypothetical protein